MLRQLKVRRHLTTLLCLATLILLPLTHLWRGSSAEAAPPLLIASMNARAHAHSHAPHVEWSRVHRDADGFVELLPGGARVELTIDPALQSHAEHILREHDTPYAAAVMISVEDGRVLALAGRAKNDPHKSIADLTLKP